MSPWLAQGSLSAKTVYYAVANLQLQTPSSALFITHLHVRDFYIFNAKYKGSSLFYEYGATAAGVHKWKVDLETINAWRTGMTGVPLIDACMRELIQTGWLSNRSR